MTEANKYIVTLLRNIGRGVGIPAYDIEAKIGAENPSNGGDHWYGRIVNRHTFNTSDSPLKELSPEIVSNAMRYQQTMIELLADRGVTVDLPKFRELGYTDELV